MHIVHRVSVLAAALLSAMAVTSQVAAADSHFLGVTANLDTFPNGGFDVGPGPADRAIYDSGSGASYAFGGTRPVGQFVFLAPYTGSGFIAPPGPAAALEGVVTLNGVNGLGIDDQVNQQITLSNQVTLGGSQTWQISSATGSIQQLSTATPAKRSLNLGASMLTLDAVNAVNFFLLNNTISGTGGITMMGAGSAILSGTNTYSGGTFFNGGTVTVAADANLGAATGVLAFNGGVLQVTGTTFTSTARTIQWGDGGGGFDIQDATNNFTLNQALTGAGQLTKLGAGTLTLAGANTYTGITTIQAGTLALTGTGSIANSSVQDNGVLDISGTTAGASIQSLAGTGAVTLGAQTLSLTVAQDTFSGSFSGTGGLTLVSGTETLTGTANDAFTGPTTVQGGTLFVDGSLANSAVSVLDGGTLAGSGTVGATSIAKGGTIAPGHSMIGTLNVQGNFQQAAGSTYQVELNPASNASDLIAVDGTASIASGAILNVTKTPPGDYQPGAVYTVLSATGGVQGTYNLTGDTAPLTAFLGVKDVYDANHVYLKVTQTTDPATAATTPNQVAVAGGVDSLQPTNPVQTGVLNSATDANARTTFDQLSGEAQASTKGVLVSNSVLVRNIALDRLRDVICADASHRTTTSSGCPVPDDAAVWAQVMGGEGNAKDGSNNAKIDQSSGGLLVGSDLAVAKDWRAGVFGGYSHTSFDVNALLSSGESKSYHFGGYAGTQWGNLVLSMGGSYTWNDISSRRWDTYGTTTDRLEANYNAGTAQAFGELGYRAQVGRGELVPFLNLAYVNLKTDGFQETGGASALSSRGDTTKNTLTTIGIRPSTSLTLGSLDATLRGMLGWRHAFGDVTPTSTVAFAGGDPFTVSGAPIAKNAAVAEVGADIRVGHRTTIGLTYAGQFGSGNTDQSLRASVTTRF
jgi:fibronectin-binding autotransporter adhesin